MASVVYGAPGAGNKKTFAIISAGFVTNMVIASEAWAEAQVAAGRTLYEMPTTPGTVGIGATQAEAASEGTPVDQ